MQTNIIWKGRFYHSIENCLLTTSDSGNEIVSTIVGDHENRIYKVEYQINTNSGWETVSLDLRTQFDNSYNLSTLEKKDGTWFLDGKPDKKLENIFDIDISLTPFTNTLAINRLKLADSERKVIEVLYFDILNKEIKPVKQIYTKLQSDLYVYENYDKSFKADIRVDEHGLVFDYPELFEMTVKNRSDYRQ